MTRKQEPAPRTIPEARRKIKARLARLELVSHGPTAKLDKAGGASTVEHPGGRRPGQDDRERATDLLEREDIKDAYQAKTVARYRRWLASIEGRGPDRGDEWLLGKLIELWKDLGETIERWTIAPHRLDDGKLTMADSGWKRYIWTCGRDSGDLAREFGCSRQYIEKVKAQNWSARNESRSEQEERERGEWERRRTVKEAA